MMVGLEARGQAIAATAEQRTIATAAERIAAALPELEVESASDGVTIAGRGLRRLLLSDAALRWIGSLWR